MKWVFTIVLFVLVACGAPEPGEEVSPAADEGAKVDEGAKIDKGSSQLGDRWAWDQAKGAARDLEADDADCRKQVGSAPKKDGDASGLFGALRDYATCMQEKGWILKDAKGPATPGE
jgi:hypothetical protein